MKFPIVFLLFALPLCTSFAQSTKRIAITIDDLPVNTTDGSDARWQIITNSILDALKKYNVPAIGFVNEGKLSMNGQVSVARTKLLDQWFAQGLELGNHTWSHLEYNTHSIDEYEADIIKGSQYIDKLYRDVPERIRYFRHPYLHTGDTREKRNALTAVLIKHNYVVAPVTVDNSDWIFARAYDIALDKKDSGMQRKLREEYVPYMVAKVKYFESQARDLFGRDISHILLMHANSINAACLGSLLQALQQEGFSFASLTEVLQDPVFKTEDDFIGRAGISWVHRWAITQKKPKTFFGNEPRVPDYIQKYSGLAE